MKKIVIFVLVALFVGRVSAQTRIWTSTTGKAMEAEYVGLVGDKVVLKTTSGAQKKIPINAFSKKDQELIYNKVAPQVDVELKRNMRRRPVQGDIDNRTQDFTVEVTVEKKSARPYTKNLKIEYYVIGEVLHRGDLVLLDAKVESFKLEGKRGETYSLTGNPVSIEYDPDPHPGFGIKYKGYIVMVSLEDGSVVAIGGKDGWQENMHVLRKAEPGKTFTEKMVPLEGQDITVRRFEYY